MIRCPLVNEEIEVGECVTTVDVCDGFVKERVLDQRILKNEDWKDVCRKCKYHEN